MAETARRVVPHEDLTRQYASLQEEIRAAIDDVLPRGKYTLGPQLTAFEQEFAAYCGVRHGIGIRSQTSSIRRPSCSAAASGCAAAGLSRPLPPPCART